MNLSINITLYPLLYIPLLSSLLFLFSLQFYSQTKIKNDLYVSIGLGIATGLSFFLFSYINEPRLFFWDKPFHLGGIVTLLIILTIKLFGDKRNSYLEQIPFYLLVILISLSFVFTPIAAGVAFSVAFISYGFWLLFRVKNGYVQGESLRVIFYLVTGLLSLVGQWVPFQSGRFLFSMALLVFLGYEIARYFGRVVSMARSAGINSITDSLTGLFNKGFMFRKVEQLIRKQEVSVIFIDIDNFKQLNDTKGHDHGDTILKAVGKTLQNVLGQKGLAFRFGGEEMVGIVTKGVAADLAERFREQVEKKVGVTVSVGVATGDADSSSLIKLADKRMYLAKNNGKNQVVIEGGD